MANATQFQSGGNVYYVKDGQARQDIADLQNAIGIAEDAVEIAYDNERTNNIIESVFGQNTAIGQPTYTFEDPIGGTNMTLMSIALSGSQTGSGTPSPDNVRPFSFPGSVDVAITSEHSAKTSRSVNTNEVAQIAHKGILYPFEGRFVLEEKKITLNGENVAIEFVTANRGFFTLEHIPDFPNSAYSSDTYTLQCDKLQSVYTSATWNNYSQFISVSYAAGSYSKIVIKPGVPIADANAAKSWLQENTPTVVYTATNRIKYAVPPIALNTYYGKNILTVTNGNIQSIQAFNKRLNEYGAQLKNNNVFDYLESRELAPPIGSSFTNSGVSFTTEIDSVVVNGTSTGLAACNLTRKKIKKGQTFHVANNGKTVYLEIFVNDSSNNTLAQFTFDKDGYFTVPNSDAVDNMLIRLSVPNGTSVSNVKVLSSVKTVPDNNNLNILVFGNSFSYSTLGYVPALVNEINPEINLTLGILYSSGMDFAGHIAKWQENSSYSMYNEYRTPEQAWQTYSNTVTGRNAIDRKRWDCIILQQSVEHLDDFDSLENFADILNSYLTYPVKFLYNMGQARGAASDTWLSAHYTGSTTAEKSNKHFADIASYAQRAEAGCIISGVLPTATAVQNARTTSLAQYGNSGNLCLDSGGHLQNGIGILCAGYAGAYTLLELTNRNGKMYGAQLTPTDSWVTSTNVPSSIHGSCVGVTNENKLLAMKCAMLAVKKPFELTDCSDL